MTMTKNEVIKELRALADGFMEVHGAVPICLEEAIRILNEEGDKKDAVKN